MPLGIGGAILGGTLIGGIFGMQGSQRQANAQTDAANTQAAAANYAADLQQKQFEETQKAMAPWREQGGKALISLADLMGTSGNVNAPGYGRLTQPNPYADFNNPFADFRFDPNQDPGYKFRLQQGMNALNQNEALSGYFKGQTGLDLQKFGQEEASQEYQNAFARNQQEFQNALASNQSNFNMRQLQDADIFNRLSGLAGTGQAAATQIGQMGLQSAGNIGNLAVGAAQAQGAGQIGAANAYAGMYQNIGNQLTSGLGSYLNYNMYQDYINRGNSNMLTERTPVMPQIEGPALTGDMVLGGGAMYGGYGGAQ